MHAFKYAGLGCSLLRIAVQNVLFLALYCFVLSINMGVLFVHAFIYKPFGLN